MYTKLNVQFFSQTILKKKILPNCLLDNFFNGFVNNFSALLLLCKINIRDIFDILNFFKDFLSYWEVLRFWWNFGCELLVANLHPWIYIRTILTNSTFYSIFLRTKQLDICRKNIVQNCSEFFLDFINFQFYKKFWKIENNHRKSWK